MFAHIGPELFGEVVYAVKGDARSHGICKVAGIALVAGVIGTANRTRSSAAENLRDIKDASSRIGSRYENASCGICSSAEKAAIPHSIITRIRAEDGWIHSHSKKLHRRGIGDVCAISLRVSLATLSIAVVDIGGLINSGLHSRSQEGKRIQEVLRDLSKLLR